MSTHDVSVWHGRIRRLTNRILESRLRARPTFFDIDAVRPELRRLDGMVDVIRAELEPHLEWLPEIPRYHEFDERQRDISEGMRDWRVLQIENCVHRGRHPMRRHFPETSKALDGVPDLQAAFFSILDPRKSIPRHSGPYLGYLRYHLGIQVPTHAPPRIRVADVDYTWKEGESVLFDDTLPHEVFNESDEHRIVLIVDILRPLPQPLDLLNRLTARTRRGA